MIYAKKDNIRIKSNPGQKANCPYCNNTVISKCGDINIWHWAHENKKECDSFREGETPWHLAWKSMFEPETVEKIIERYGKKHIADVYHNETVIELQNSTISTSDIHEREVFYNKMIWLFNGNDFFHNFDLRKKDNIYTFRWKHPRKSMFYCYKKIFIDFGFCSDIPIPSNLTEDEYYYLDLNYLELNNKIFEVKKYITIFLVVAGEFFVIIKKH